MAEILEEFAAAGPDGIYFPIFPAEGEHFAGQAQEKEGLEDATLLTSSAFLLTEFPFPAAVAGHLLRRSGAGGGRERQRRPPARASTTCSRRFRLRTASLRPPRTGCIPTTRERCCSAPSSPSGRSWTARSTSTAPALREALGATEDFEGLLGTLSCDDFGDCGTGAVNIYHHTDPEITDPAQLQIVYQFAP